MKSAPKILIVLLCLTVFAGFAEADSILTAVPLSSGATVGSNVTVNVFISNSLDLYAFGLDLIFNPAVLSAGTVTEGAFLAGGGSTAFVPGSIDNVAGTISFNGDTLVGAIPGVNGGGTLMTFDFLAIGTGTTALTLQNALFLNSSFSSIPVALQGGSVTVSSAVVGAPEPSTSLMLMAGALVCLALLKIRPQIRPLLPSA